MSVTAAALYLLTSTEAGAFCRTTTCDPTMEECPIDPTSHCITEGEVLYWSHPCVGFSLQQDASRQVGFDPFVKATEAAFRAWTSAKCAGDTHPGLVVYDMGPIPCHQAEYNKVAGNANIIMFRDDAWPYKNTIDTLALTTVTFNPDSGEIYDADIEINTAQAQFTTSDSHVKYDLQGILTHEIGHFLGLDHTDVPSATMFPSYQQGDLRLRDLDPDDEAGVCDAFPPQHVPKDCDFTPRHGYQTTCGDREPEPPEQPKGCCSSSVAPGGQRGPLHSTLAAILLGFSLAGLRRRTSS